MLDLRLGSPGIMSTNMHDSCGHGAILSITTKEGVASHPQALHPVELIIVNKAACFFNSSDHDLQGRLNQNI